MNKLIFALNILVFSISTYATEVKRLLIPSVDGIHLDSFEYLPDNPSLARGVILVIGGSGFTHAGFGGPARFATSFSQKGYFGIEWNKRGIVTNTELKDTSLDVTIYNTAIIENIFKDASQVLTFVKSRYPGLPIFVLGGSEGSVTTTLLAEHFPTDIKAAATFGNVVMPFIQTSSMQITDLFLKENWKSLDINVDDKVTAEELSTFKSTDEEFTFLANANFSKADLSNDGFISFKEMSAFIVNHFVNEHPNSNYWLDSSGVANGYLASMYKLAPLTYRANNITIPVFMAQGEDDWNTPVQDVYEFQIQCKALNKNNFTFKYYAGVGHAPSNDMFNDFLNYFSSFISQ